MKSSSFGSNPLRMKSLRFARADRGATSSTTRSAWVTRRLRMAGDALSMRASFASDNSTHIQEY
ncbi:hypothetical protein GGQ88_004044 [Novosphingobium hassiacum]|uniref:Uncharacterized protein n=1 Tax=Novosphingobium hassiacum TaxID=173676 RepID=A0A7W6EXU2_9SPHN|nr:hypothetical protein [Novosphingobium hassiacum]